MAITVESLLKIVTVVVAVVLHLSPVMPVVSLLTLKIIYKKMILIRLMKKSINIKAFSMLMSLIITMNLREPLKFLMAISLSKS